MGIDAKNSWTMPRMVVCCLVVIMTVCSCNLFFKQKEEQTKVMNTDSSYAFAAGDLPKVDSAKEDGTRMADTAIMPYRGVIDTKNVHPDALVAFAESLAGIPYHYGSSDPKVGFDCSGFITYVFNHFHIAVPRSSIDFTNTGSEISLDSSKRGDLILFTGTDSTEPFVGHMGIIVSNINNGVHFIHATSGKAQGVTITPLNDYYKSRLVKTIRVFKE